MKLLKLIFLATLTCTLANAQNDYSKDLNGIDWVKVESKADITVMTHDKNEIRIKAGKKQATPDRAKGLKLVGEGGSDNTNVGFYVVQDGNSLIVKNLRRSEGGEIWLPAKQNIAVKTTQHGDIKVQGVKGAIEANAQLNGGVQIKGVSGPVTANSLNGQVEVIFEKVNQDSPISIYTTNGAVDVTMPTNTPANLYMSSWNGDIYTNFDLDRPEKDGLKSVAGRKVEGSLNGGGVGIKLKSTNGNIYLRKN